MRTCLLVMFYSIITGLHVYWNANNYVDEFGGTGTGKARESSQK